MNNISVIDLAKCGINCIVVTIKYFFNYSGLDLLFNYNRCKKYFFK